MLIADRDNNRIRLLMQTLCGNGRTEGTEGCDDGNDKDADGCSSSCRVESGYKCRNACLNFCTRVSPSTCKAQCGDGIQVLTPRPYTPTPTPRTCTPNLTPYTPNPSP
jgi:cysteine-rich repeat protein